MSRPDRRCGACGRVKCVCADPRPRWQLVAVAYAAESILVARRWGIYPGRAT